MADTPVWRQAYDRFEQEVGPRLEELLRSEQFAVAAGLVSRLQRSMEAESGKATRRVLHRLNLPAGSDVTRILNEIGQLRRQIHELQVELTDTQRALRAARAEIAAAAEAAPATRATGRRSNGAAARRAATTASSPAHRAAPTKKGGADGGRRRS